jgi:hypothetical protein
MLAEVGKSVSAFASIFETAFEVLELSSILA